MSPSTALNLVDSGAVPRDGTGASPSLVVFSPSPVLTVTIEQSSAGQPEVHLHPGAQGPWIARMIREMGGRVLLCSPFGGETGTVLRALLEEVGIPVRATATAEWNGSYVHDRRTGERVVVAETPSATLSRHELDDLYGATLTASLDADLTVLAGPRDESVLDVDTYRRLGTDLGANGGRVVADLSGPALAAALEGGLELVKVNDDEAIAAGFLDDRADPAALATAAQRLHDAGARTAVITRGARPLLASVEGRLVEIAGPMFTPLDSAGTGDSFFAATSVALAGGLPMLDALRLGVAAGALNATRHGLGSGDGRDIGRLAKHVEVTAVAA